MQKKLLTKIVITVFCLIFACKHVEEKSLFVLSNVPAVQALEKQDHGFCSSLKINFDKTVELYSNLYWRCRMSLSKYHLRTDNLPESQQFNSHITDLINKIAVKIADTPASILEQQNNKMDERHHKKCLAMGYQSQSEDLTKIDDYFSCRRALIEEQQLVPPFGNDEYLDYPNSSYNIGFVVDRRLDIQSQRLDAAKAKYPTCIKYNLNSLNFNNCTAAQDKSRQCFSQINKKKFVKEMEEKITCQKLAYIRFPNDLLKEIDAQKLDIERMKTSSDFYNQLSFSALGIDSRDFAAPQSETEKDKEKNAKKAREAEAQKINSNANMYDKFELTRLRQKYIRACQKEADLRVLKHISDLEKECSAAENFVILQ